MRLLIALAALAVLAGCGATATRLDRLGAKPAGNANACSHRVTDYLDEADREHKKVGSGGDVDAGYVEIRGGPRTYCGQLSRGTSVADYANYMADKIYVHDSGL